MTGEGEAGTRQLTSVEVCRLMAAEIWRSERPHEHLSVHGLNSERAVRERLQKISMELEAAPDIDDVIALSLLAINWGQDDPLSIMEKTENMLIVHRGGSYSTPDQLLADSGTSTIHLMRLSIVQSLAGRLGRWAVRSGEIPDARTARTLYKDLGEAHWSQYRALLVASEELHKTGRHRDSAISLLDADRLVRTPAALLQAAISLTKAGDYISALWAIRAALLEPKSTFESADAHLKAHKIEGRLRAVIEGRVDVPLAMDEAQLLVGDTEVPPQRREELAAGAKVIVTAASSAAAGKGAKVTVSAGPSSSRYAVTPSSSSSNRNASAAPSANRSSSTAASAAPNANRSAGAAPNAGGVIARATIGARSTVHTASARPPASAPGSRALEMSTVPRGPLGSRALETSTATGGAGSSRAFEIKTMPGGPGSSSAFEMSTVPGGPGSARALEMTTAPDGPGSASSHAFEMTTVPGGPGSASALELTTVPGGPSSAALLHARIDEPRRAQSAVGRTLLTKRAILTMRVPAASERMASPVRASSVESGVARVPRLAHLLPPSLNTSPDPYAARTVVDPHPPRTQQRERSNAPGPIIEVALVDEPGDVPLTHSDEALFAPVHHPNLPPGDESTQVPAARIDDLVIPERAPIRRPRSDRFRAITSPANADHRALLRAEREASTEDVHALPLLAAALEAAEGEESTQVPSRPPSDPFAVNTVRTALESGAPIAHRATTLPPNTQHRQLLRAEQYRFAPQTREIGVVAEGESPWEAMLSESAPPRLVSEVFDIDVVWEDGTPAALEPAGPSASTEDAWEAVVVPEDAIVSIVPEPEDLPTDMIEPIHLLDVLRRPQRAFGGAAHEVTERIRDRNPAR